MSAYVAFADGEISDTYYFRPMHLSLLCCVLLSLAGGCALSWVMAESGNMQLEITNHMYKTRLDLSGKVIRGDKKKRVERNPVRQAVPAVKQAELPPGYCGSCYGAAPDVRMASCAHVEATGSCTRVGFARIGHCQYWLSGCLLPSLVCAHSPILYVAVWVWCCAVPFSFLDGVADNLLQYVQRRERGL